MIPSQTYRTTLKFGMSGHEIWALQICLTEAGFTIGHDGAFGEITLQAVKDYQVNHGLVGDGIAGPRTQKSLALVLTNPDQQLFEIPGGLLRGIIENESGWAVGAVSWSVPGGVDCGYYQKRVLTGDFTDGNFYPAFSCKTQAFNTAKYLRDLKAKFREMPGATTDKRAWQLAALDHNWPWGAEHLAEGGKLSTSKADWVVNIGVAGVTTPAQWADFYISKVTIYVKEWRA